MRAALHHQGKAMQTTDSCSLVLTSHPHHLALSHASGIWNTAKAIATTYILGVNSVKGVPHLEPSVPFLHSQLLVFEWGCTGLKLAWCMVIQDPNGSESLVLPPVCSHCFLFRAIHEMPLHTLRALVHKRRNNTQLPSYNYHPSLYLQIGKRIKQLSSFLLRNSNFLLF